jgi:lysophospholipase L1-like esterase
MINLDNFFKDKQAVTISFIGGSVTAGACASTKDKCYRMLVTTWLQERYTKTKIVSDNAAIGGTCSDLGVCRVDSDVLPKKPDIVFVEFGVNDIHIENDIVDCMEGIVRKILKNDPDTLIVFLYVLRQSYFEEEYSNGQIPYVIKAHQKVAAYYNIPSINVGMMLSEHILKVGEPFSKYIADVVHPNDTGYQFYADKIIETLTSMIWDISWKDKPLSVSNFENATIIGGIADGNWQTLSTSLFGDLETFVYSNIVGAGITTNFNGSMIGVYFSIDMDAGNILYSIDEGEWQEISTWTSEAPKYSYRNYKILANDLSDTNHNIKVKVSSNKDIGSIGHFIRLGGFLVGKS